MATFLRYSVTVEFDVPAGRPTEVAEKIEALSKIATVNESKTRAKSVHEPKPSSTAA